jgi:lipoprotein-anchoring transpeptidase ErfK/SrfK
VLRSDARTTLTNRRICSPCTANTVSAAVAAVAAVSAGLLLSSCSGPSGGGARVASARQAVARHAAVRLTALPTAPQAGRPRRDAVPISRGPASTVVATVLRAAPGYASSGGIVTGTVPASWYGRPSVLPVIATRPGWVQVRLAQRPNGSTAWLPASDVTLGRTPYRIVVNNTTAQLALYDLGKLVFSAPAGVGTTDDPTPTGAFFVAFDEQPPQPNPGYGPFIIVTSAHSQAISDWENSGDAIIGIHGPLGEDSEIGTAGARISHGCVRLHDEALERLTEVPPGTPIDVVS